MPETPVGALGAAAVGTTDVDAVEAAEVPTIFVAVTVKEYPPPAVSPVTVHGVVVAVQVNPPAVDVTVYEVMAAPPVDAGAVQDTAAEPLPATAVTAVGAPGTVAGVPDTKFDDALLPMALTARIPTT